MGCQSRRLLVDFARLALALPQRNLGAKGLGFHLEIRVQGLGLRAKGFGWVPLKGSIRGPLKGSLGFRV